MSDVIQFLEALARHPRGLDHGTRDEALAGMPPAARDALLTGNVVALAQALDARAVMACLIAAPENDEPAQDDLPGDQDDRDTQDSEAA